MGRFETEFLTQSGDLQAPMNLPEKWIDQMNKRMPGHKLSLDLDSSVNLCNDQKPVSEIDGRI